MQKLFFQNNLINKKELKQILLWTFVNSGAIDASMLADQLKVIGFKYSTLAGISISIEDLQILPLKNKILEQSNKEIVETYKNCFKGKITEVERFQKVIEIWNSTCEILKSEIVTYFKTHDPLNSVYNMAMSGARGNLSQVLQLMGIRGLMSNPSGQIIDVAIKKNFKEGLTITDYLISGYGARKGTVDTSLKTANSGYLTRRLIDVVQDVLIKENDCFTEHSIFFTGSKICTTIDKFGDNSALGRVVNLNRPATTVNPYKVLKRGTLIQLQDLLLSKIYGISNIFVRSPLTCELYGSICQKCYGWDLTTKKLINLGEAIGIIAGQSIGEPGTQLTMRTFHTGGVFTGDFLTKFVCPAAGTVEFSESLKTIPFRRITGENILKSENAGFLKLRLKTNKIFKIEIPSQTLLFVKNKEFINCDVLIGEFLNTNKQIKVEIKNIFSKVSGELCLKKNILWVLKCQIFKIYTNSYLNKRLSALCLKNDFISRIKFINTTSGIIDIIKDKLNLENLILRVQNSPLIFLNSKIEKLNSRLFDSLILNIKNKNFLLKRNIKIKDVFAKLLTLKYATNTGGTFYRVKNFSFFSNSIKISKNFEFKEVAFWMPEETHHINANSKPIFVKNRQYVLKHTPIGVNVLSKNAGIIAFSKKNGIVDKIAIKPGIFVRLNNLQNFDRIIVFPGEKVLKNRILKQIAFLEKVVKKVESKILFRPFSLYNHGPSQPVRIINNQNNLLIKHVIVDKLFDRDNFKTKNACILYEEYLVLEETTLKNFSLQFLSNIQNENQFSIDIYEYLNVSRYNIENKISLIVQQGQFVNVGTTLGYFENVLNKSLTLVTLKLKKNNNVFLVRKEDCLIVPTKLFPTKQVNDLLNENTVVKCRGKILYKTPINYIVQKGYPYYFLNNSHNRFSNADTIIKNDKIGALIFEKEITGDIVQGLPRVEKILEVVKNDKQIVTWTNKMLGLDAFFTFTRIESFIQAQKNLNLHTFLLIYFSGYKKFKNLYEATYCSLKKLQVLILTSVQTVYQSQKVTISDKHLEIIIKQMTTKVQIVGAGRLILNLNSLIALNKINYINKIRFSQRKTPIIYQPILLGLTKASANSESFLSSASFRETTTVLMKTAIEGEIDWLKGLKENVITGQLIPAGTGFAKSLPKNIPFFIFDLKL